MTDIAPSGQTPARPTAAAPVVFVPEMEQPRADEERDIERIVRALHGNNEYAFRKYKCGVRDVHAKSHGILRGTLEVLPDLPNELAQGVFATPRKYPVISRLSSTSGAIRSAVASAAW